MGVVTIFKNKFIERRVFHHRKSPNDKRASETVHDIIALSDDPIVAQQLRAAQETQRASSLHTLQALTNGPDHTALTEQHDVEWSDEFGFGGRAKRRRTNAPHTDLLQAEPQDWSIVHDVRTRNPPSPP